MYAGALGRESIRLAYFKKRLYVDLFYNVLALKHIFLSFLPSGS